MGKYYKPGKCGYTVCNHHTYIDKENKCAEFNNALLASYEALGARPMAYGPSYYWVERTPSAGYYFKSGAYSISYPYPCSGFWYERDSYYWTDPLHWYWTYRPSSGHTREPEYKVTGDPTIRCIDNTIPELVEGSYIPLSSYSYNYLLTRGGYGLSLDTDGKQYPASFLGSNIESVVETLVESIRNVVNDASSNLELKLIPVDVPEGLIKSISPTSIKDVNRGDAIKFDVTYNSDMIPGEPGSMHEYNFILRIIVNKNDAVIEDHNMQVIVYKPKGNVN